MLEKYTKKVPEQSFSSDHAVRSENRHRIRAAEVFNSLPLEERKSKIWAERRKTARDILIPVAALGALSVVGHEATGAPWHVKDHTPSEKHEDHQGIVHVSKPGEGVLNTKTGNFRVTQDGQQLHGSIGAEAPTDEVTK